MKDSPGGCKWVYLHMPFPLVCPCCYGDSQLGAGKEESAVEDAWRMQHTPLKHRGKRAVEGERT